MDREWLQSDGEKRKEQQREPIAMLAEGECVLEWVKDVRVEEVQRVRKSLVIVPPEDPRHEVRVTSVDDHVPQTRHIGPR